MHQEGAQSGSGRQQVTQVIRNMPYAPTRAVVEADCFEVMCRTMKATLGTMADRVRKGTPEVQQAYTRALDTMQTPQWVRVGFNSDTEIMERKALRRFDSTHSFLPMKTRILQNHKQTAWVMVHEGGLISKSNSGTMTTIVIDTIRDNPRFEYGEHILAISDESLEATLTEELKALQRQSRATNQLLDEHNNPEYMMNRSQCFDLCRLETISKEEALVFPWKCPGLTLNHQEHRAMLYADFEYLFAKCAVSPSRIEHNCFMLGGGRPSAYGR